jgi:hypothetical protein
VGGFRLWKNCKTFPQVSVTSVGLCSRKFRIFRLSRRISRVSLWSRIFDIQGLLLETWFECTETVSSGRGGNHRAQEMEAPVKEQERRERSASLVS